MKSGKSKKIAICVALALVVAAVPLGAYAARAENSGKLCDTWLVKVLGCQKQEEMVDGRDNQARPEGESGEEGQLSEPGSFNGQLPEQGEGQGFPGEMNGEMPEGEMPEGQFPGQPPQGFPGEMNGEMPEGQFPGQPPQGFPGEMNGEMPEGQFPGQPPQGVPGEMNGEMPEGEMPEGQFPGGMNSENGFSGQLPGQNGTVSGNATEPSEIVTSSLTSNSAERLTADTANAETIVMSDENNNVKISAAGTYIISGTCADGSIAVKKGTTGVVLILKDLDLTSTSSATLSLNKGSEVKVIIQGTVRLTDAEDIALEDTDDFDGAAIKAKVGSSVVLTGSGTLYVNGECKHGIKVSGLDDEDIAEGYTDASFIIDGANLIITAADDGINSGSDLTIKSGSLTVSAADDGIKADYILTIGGEGTSGPAINIKESGEAIEGATVNIYSGDITVNASDDGINAANKDLTDYTYSLNIMGGNIVINAVADGLDSNGNINITGGLTTINSAGEGGGEGGIDYEGSCYIAEGTLVNPYGTTFDSGMGGQMGPGAMNGQMPGQAGQGGVSGQMPGQMGQGGVSGQMPGQTGRVNSEGQDGAQGFEADPAFPDSEAF